MLTGSKPFPGDDVTQTLARVVEREPDWTILPDSVPPVLRTFIRRCLQKDPKQRIRDIGDVGLAMEGVFEAPASPAGEKSGTRPMPKARVALAITAAVGTALVLGVLLGGARHGELGDVPVQGVTRLQVDIAPEQHLSGGLALEESAFARQRPSRTSFSLSPNGRELVYVASDGEISRLYRRSMAQAQAALIPGTAGASSPFFAPDGESLGFFVGSELKRLSLDSGEVRTVSTVGPAFATYGERAGLDAIRSCFRRTTESTRSHPTVAAWLA